MKANFKKYVSIVLAMCLAMVLVCLVACKGNEHTHETTLGDVANTTLETTTPDKTTTEATTPETPTETVTFPSDEEVDPKQEDVFFE